MRVCGVVGCWLLSEIKITFHPVSSLSNAFSLDECCRKRHAYKVFVSICDESCNGISHANANVEYRPVMTQFGLSAVFASFCGRWNQKLHFCIVVVTSRWIMQYDNVNSITMAVLKGWDQHCLKCSCVFLFKLPSQCTTLWIHDRLLISTNVLCF